MTLDVFRWRLTWALLMAAGFGMAGTAQNGLAGQAAPAPAPISITRANAPVVIHELRESWRLETDGRARRTLFARVTLQDENALQQWGQLTFPYSSEHESLTLERLVIAKPDGSEIVVDPQTLQEAPATESGTFESPTFSDTRLKQVTVPALAEGDTVEYEVIIERHTPLHPGHFWTAFDFERGSIVEQEVFEIDYPADYPVHVKVWPEADAHEQPASLESGREVRRWTRSQLTVEPPDEKQLLETVKQLLRGHGPPPDVQVSTFRSWDDVAAWYADLATGAERVDDALEARAAALVRAGDEDGAWRALHRLVAQEVRYVALAFGEGRYRPRPAARVLSTKYGDCKDKHSLLATLGRAIGLTVQPVLIATSRDLDPDLPSPGQFDHVISLVTDRTGRRVWVDATAEFARPGELSLPLRGKRALLIEPGGIATIVSTPAELPAVQRARIEISGAYESDGRLSVTVHREVTGDSEMLLRSVFHQATAQQRSEIVKAFLEDDGLGSEATLTRFDNADPRDLEEPFWFEYEAERTFTSPYRAEMWAFWPPAPRFNLAKVGKGDTEVDLGQAGEVEIVVSLRLPTELEITAPVPVSLALPAGTYASAYTATDGVVSVHRTLRLTSNHVPSSQTASYRAFRQSVEADYQQRFAVGAAAANLIASAGGPQNFASAGADALNRGAIADAVSLLRRAVAASPQHLEAWNNLGRALHAQGRWTDALDAYERQIEINPYDQYSYNNKGLSLWALERLDEAERSFRKQIEISPLNGMAHANLGRLLLELERPTEAREVLERAASMEKSNANVHVALGRAQADVGLADEALASFERAVSLSATPSVWNQTAWYMAEHDLALDTALGFARSAVATTAARSLAATLDEPTDAHLALAGALGMYWDTLGWIHYKRGAVEEGLRYLRGSWQISRDPDVAVHLGEVLEHLKRPDDALRVYQIGLMLDRPKADLLAHARALTGADSNPLADARASGISTARAVELGDVAPAGTTTELMLLLDSSGNITAAKPAAGSEGMNDVVRRVVGRRVPLDAPDGTPFKVVVRAALTCSEEDACVLVIFAPRDALRLARESTREH